MKSQLLLKIKSHTFLIKVWRMITFLLVSVQTFGQVTYRVGLDADKITYRVYMKSVSNYSGIQAKISTAQVTLVVPHGIGASQFIPSNVTGKIAGSNQMSWGVSRADNPTENPTSDYISFGFSGSGSAILFDIIAGQEIELFRFQNTGNCLGTVNLITDSDPFLPPNSNNSNPGNQMTILGYGQSNAYSGNYGGGVSCQSTFPDLTVAITGASNITAGVATNYSIAVNNIGTAASSGQISVATTLPNGVSYNSFSGVGWIVNAVPQGNGTTIVTAANNSSVAINGSLNALQLNVTAAASIGNGNSISLNSTISGGGDSNLTNNTSSTSSTVTVNSPDLSLTMSGPTNISPNATVNYTLNLANIGLVSTSGLITASVTLPNGLFYNSFIGNGWTYVNSTLQNGGAMLLTFTYNNAINANGSASALVVNAMAANNLSNNAVLTITGNISGGGDNTLVNNSGLVNTTVVVTGTPDFVINITGASSVVAGNSTNYTITINNSGNAASIGQISVSTTLPSGVLYNSFSGMGWSVNAVPQGNGTTIVTATFNTNISAGNSANLLILNVTPQTNISNGNTITINTTVSGGGDVSSANNSDSISTIIINMPVLGVNISGSNSIVVGINTNFTININNSGTGSTSGQITTTTTLPNGVVYNSFSGTGWSVIASPQPNGTTLITATYTGTVVAGGAANPLILNVTPQQSIANSGTITINTIVSGGGNANNVSGNINFVVVEAPSLSMTINGNTSITAGNTGNFTFNITNNSSSATSGQVTNTITLPVGVSYNSFTGAGWSFVSSSPQPNGTTILVFTNNNAIVTSSSLALNLTFASNLVNNISLIINGVLSGGGSQNATGNITITIIPAPKSDLTLNLIGTSNTAPNGNASYTFNINNIGNLATTGQITASILLPNGLSYTSFTGSGWSYGSSTLQTGGAILVTFTTNTIIAANGLNNNLVVNIVAGNLPNATLLNITGNVSGGGEIVTTNNSGATTLTIVVQGTPQLTSTITGPSTITPNTPYNYTINVNNIGNLITSGNVSVSTILPVGIIYNSTSGTNWSSIATLQPNGTTLVVSTYTGVISINGTANPLVLNVTPSGTLPSGSIITINGSVTGGGANNTGNNTFTINSTVASSGSTADLSVMVTLDNKTPNLGQNINYTFTVTNNGLGSPSNVQNLIKLPPGFMISSFNTDAGTFNQNTGIWTIGNIANGQAFSLTIVGKPTVEGIDFASIQIIYSNLQDNVSNNNIAKVCYATPVSLCAGEGYIAYLDKQATNIKWFKNSTQINLATADSLLISSAGNYSASFTNSCGTIVNTPNITITIGIPPASPIITANKTTICSTEVVQLTAFNCADKITWNTGATTSSINVNIAGTYTATCTNVCGVSQASAPIVITENCGAIGKIGDYVWYDNNNNGKQDVDENGVKGVILELFKDDISTGIKDTTDSQGKYLFTNLVSGNYQVKIYTASFPADYSLSRKSNAVGVADSLDSDFDFVSNLSPTVVINTSVVGQSSNLTIDGGIRLNPGITLIDPCRCFGKEYGLDEIKEVSETIRITSASSQVWKIIQHTGMLILDSLAKNPIPIGTQFVETSAGIYELKFTHEDNIGYTVKITNGEDTLSIGNKCSVYPKIQVTNLNRVICKNEPPISLSAVLDVPGSSTFYYIHKTTKQKVVITSFDPKDFSPGDIVYIKIDVVPANGNLCTFIVGKAVQISINDCDLNCKPKVCVPISVQKTK